MTIDAARSAHETRVSVQRLDPRHATAAGATLGSLDGGMLETADCQKTFEELSENGVTFLQEPAERLYGIEALFRDYLGNWFSLTQPNWLG